MEAITNFEGTVIWEAEYTAFGEVISFSPNGFDQQPIFSGKTYDPDAEMYYFNARWYDPTLGRFISEDPIRDGFNWYTAMGNNPVINIDPSGLGLISTIGSFLGKVADALSRGSGGGTNGGNSGYSGPTVDAVTGAAAPSISEAESDPEGDGGGEEDGQTPSSDPPTEGTGTEGTGTEGTGTEGTGTEGTGTEGTGTGTTAKDNDEMHNNGGGGETNTDSDDGTTTPNPDREGETPEGGPSYTIPENVNLPLQTELPYSNYPNASTACHFAVLIAIPQIILGKDLDDNSMQSIAETLMETPASFQPNENTIINVMDNEFYVLNPDDVINAVFDALGVPDARSTFVGSPMKGSVFSFIIVENEVENDPDNTHFQLADVKNNIIYDPFPNLNLTKVVSQRQVHLFIPGE